MPKGGRPIGGHLGDGHTDGQRRSNRRRELKPRPSPGVSAHVPVPPRLGVLGGGGGWRVVPRVHWPRWEGPAAAPGEREALQVEEAVSADQVGTAGSPQADGGLV